MLTYALFSTMSVLHIGFVPSELNRSSGRADVKSLKSSNKPKRKEEKKPTMNPLSIILILMLLTLNIICHTFSLVITSKYQLHVFDPVKACPTPHASLMLKSRVICAAMNDPRSTSKNFSLQLKDNALVCSNTTNNNISKSCHQVYSQSRPKTRNTSPIKPVALVTAAKEEDNTRISNPVQGAAAHDQTSSSQGRYDANKIRNR